MGDVYQAKDTRMQRRVKEKGQTTGTSPAAYSTLLYILGADSEGSKSVL
jgi:hypothetical protein